jgi:molecular chaperone GrpE
MTQETDNAGGDTSNNPSADIDPVGSMFDNEAELEALRAEKTAVYEKLARVQADFTNARKRLEADAEQRLAYANQSLIESLLPVIDNFERALAQDPTKVDAVSILRGMTLVSEQLKSLVAKYNVEAVDPKPGDDFDPNLHQAIMQQESDLPEGKVTMLLQKGYMMKGRVVRPAQVAVSKAK